MAGHDKLKIQPLPLPPPPTQKSLTVGPPDPQPPVGNLVIPAPTVTPSAPAAATSLFPDTGDEGPTPPSNDIPTCPAGSEPFQTNTGRWACRPVGNQGMGTGDERRSAFAAADERCGGPSTARYTGPRSGADGVTPTLAEVQNPANWGCDGPKGTGSGSGNTGGTGGGGGGAPSINFGQFGLSQGEQDLQGNILDAINQMLKNGETRFSPKVLAALFSKLKENQSATVENETQAINEDLASRGLRGGIGTELIAGVRRGAASDFTRGTREVLIQKAQTDFDDKMTALTNAQSFLAQQQAFIIARESNDISRNIALSNIALAYRRIQVQIMLAREQFKNQIDLAELGLLPSLTQNVP